MTGLSLGVMSRSSKENERRLPIHPLHLERIDAELRSHIYLEHGYGRRFGAPDERLAPLVAGLRSREQLLEECDVILLAKPLARDLRQMRRGQVAWGWAHCVQNEGLTQAAIDRRLTVIAFEAMHRWSPEGSLDLHVFHQNSELAGYCSVLHALAVIGSTGAFGRRLRAAVIGFGATGRGAVRALAGHGVHDVDILTRRGVAAVGSPIHSARLVHLERERGSPCRSYAHPHGGRVPLAAFLAEHDVIVNCVLQDADEPFGFLTVDDLAALAPGTLIVDVSCDEGMGFSWARPTSFSSPTFMVGDGIHYYAVDHSPAYMWNSATWEISEALLPYLRAVLTGDATPDVNETIRRAIEIRQGTIENPKIISFQQRSADYPHARRRAGRILEPSSWRGRGLETPEPAA